MKETATELVAAGAEALTGRRVRRYFLTGGSGAGRYYSGVVEGPPKKKLDGSKLVSIYYEEDNSHEDLDAVARSKRGPPYSRAASRAALRPQSLAACILSGGVTSSLAGKRKSGAGGASPPSPPPAASPKPSKKAPKSPGAGLTSPAKSPTPKKSAKKAASSKSPSAPSPLTGHRFKGITKMSSGLWKAQLAVNPASPGGKKRTVVAKGPLAGGGFATERDAAEGWNVLARAEGRTDLNILDDDEAAEAEAAAEEAEAEAKPKAKKAKKATPAKGAAAAAPAEAAGGGAAAPAAPEKKAGFSCSVM